MHYTTPRPGYGPSWGPYMGHDQDPQREIGIEDDGLAQWEADEIAAEQIASTAASVVDWLGNVCNDDASSKPVETHLISDAQLQDAPVAVLLACIMTGTDRQATFARMFLRDRFQADRKDEITERSVKLIEQANIHRDYCSEE